MSRLRLLSIASLTALAAGCSQSESIECGPDVFCPPGFQCIQELSYCINPLETLCGNGVQDEGEQCDDGNFTNGDGCSWNCRKPVCGDRLVDTYDKDGVPFVEVCDDGNTSNGDGCSTDCGSIELCGDGQLNQLSYTLQTPAYGQEAGLRIDRAEECDPKPGGVNEVATAECNLDCSKSRCGDGKVNEASGEECDPGTGVVQNNDKRALAPTADCNVDCTFAVCGDGQINSAHLPRLGSTQGEQCDLGKFCADAQLTKCTSNDDCIALSNSGGTLTDLECKTRNLACCTSECFSTKCGDGIAQDKFVCPAGTPQAECDACQAAWVPEQCDDGNNTNADGCDSLCRTEECGDGQVTTHAYTRIRALAAGGSANAEGTGLVYEFQPNTQVFASEICDDGKQCSVNGKNCQVDADCQAPNGDAIGDGRCLPRNGDGCSADCLSRETCGANDGFLNDYPVLVCQRDENGDCMRDPQGAPIPVSGGQRLAEVCDDGNNNPSGGTDVCAPTCLSTGICGNGVLDAGEQCDYGRQLNGSNAKPVKELEPFCQEGALPEPQACDFPCNRDCSLNVQGDGKVDPGEQCDDGTTCADGNTCDPEAPDVCATVLSDDKACIHRNNDNCTDEGRLNLCGDGIPNIAGGWAGILTIDPALLNALEARFGKDNGIPKQVCDSNGINEADCDRDCTVPECGDVILCANLPETVACAPNSPLINYSADETCDNGPGGGAGQTLESGNCNTNCQIAFCGDGVTNVTRGEACDDGNNIDGDGCAGNCLSEEFCGDGVANRYEISVENTGGELIAFRPAEVCDAGPDGGDDCTADCQSTKVCSDRYINDNETCDDGNAAAADGCSAECEIEDGWDCPTRSVTVGNPLINGFVTYETTDRCTEVCGDGLVVGAETCDDNNTDNGDGCSANCQIEVGWDCDVDSVPEEDWESETPPPHQLGGGCAPICGDRLIRGAEQCDDGNVDSNDGCSSLCVREQGYNCPCTSRDGFTCGVTGGVGGACGSVCGDGEVIGFEECDDNNLIDGDGCNAGCRAELGWVCPSDGGECLPECGDFVIRGNEECDDGNRINGDGCDANCKKEGGWVCPAGMTIIGGQCVAECGDGLVRGTETCDDSNTDSGDGCDSGCRSETGWTCPLNVGPTGAGGACAPTCGDGLIRGGETCDEGLAGSAADGVTGGCTACAQQTGWSCPTGLLTGGLCHSVCGDNTRTTTARAGYEQYNEECDAGPGNSNTGDCTLGCKVATCNDGLYAFSGTHVETDVDCGGVCLSTATPGVTAPQRCALNKGCLVNTDCQTNYCDPVGKVCTAPPIVAPTLYVLEGTPLTIQVVSTLFGGNTGIDLNTFEIIGGGDSACGGDVNYDKVNTPNDVVFVPEPAATASHGEEGCTVGNGSAYSDAFSYRVCAIGGAPCFTATVTVVVNRRPVVADTTQCLPVNTASASLNVLTIYSDADGHAINPASITSTGGVGTHNKSGTTVTFTPTNAATAATHTVTVTASDTSSTPGSDSATWTLQWNDPPVVAGRTGGNAINVFINKAATAVPLYTAANRIITNNGTVNTGISSVTVGATNNGPFGPTSITARGSCTVTGNPLTNGTIVYTAGATTGSDSCFVRVCESCSGADVCSVAELAYNVVPLPVANDDQVFGLAGLPGMGASATFTVTELTQNDQPSGVTNFAFTGTPSNSTSCGGTVTNNAGAITYTGPTNPTVECMTDDSFTYRVCSPIITSECDSATVHIEINQRPVLADTFTCSPINTPNRSINVNDLFTDPDSDLLVGSSIQATGTGGASSRVGNVVTWTPDAVATATTYTVNLTACDDAAAPGCDTAVWTAVWNDPPQLRTFPDSAPIPVVVTEASTHALKTGGSPIIIGTGAVTGVPSGDEPIASTAVGQFSNGPFAATTSTTLGGTCAISGTNVVYTAGSTAGNDSCFVQVCETCSGNNVCAVTRIPFKVIAAPAPVADTVQAAEDSAGRARGTFAISALVANDLHINSATFALKSGPGIPSCTGASVAVSGQNVIYTGPTNIASCATTDTFVYTVCSPDIPARCADATVTVDINRRPAFTNAFTCMPQGSTRGTYTVDAPNFTDSDNDDVGVVQATPAGGNPGLATVSGATVTWAPDNRDLARLYTINLNICDDASNPACTTGTWTTSWNDPPNLNATFSVGCNNPTAGTLCVDGGNEVTLPFDHVDANKKLITNFGAVIGVPATAPTPIGVVTFPSQPQKGTVSVVTNGSGVPTGIKYAANSITDPSTTDAFIVRVCELCDGNNTVCSERNVSVNIYRASVAAADTFGVLFGGSSPVLVPRSFFTNNDTSIEAGTFTLVANSATCGGAVSMANAGADVSYTPSTDEGVLAGCNWSASFQYTVERTGLGGTVTGTVTIPVNRSPTLTDAFTCQPTGTASHTLNLVSTGIYTDPNDASSTLSALTATGTTGLTTSVPNRTVTLTPSTPAIAQRFAVAVTATDNAPNTPNNARGNATGTWHSVWNDAPTFKTLTAIPVGGGTTVSVPFADIVDGVGAQNGLPLGSTDSPWASVQVGAANGGPFADLANLGNGSECEVTGTLATSQIAFTAGTTGSSKTCYVRVCEVCGLAPACAVKAVQFTLVHAGNDSFNAAEQAQLTLNVATQLLNNDSNYDASTFSLVIEGSTSDGGTVNFNSPNQVIYVSKAGPSATDSFQYQICATGNVGCAVGTVTINLNRKPTIAAATSCVPLDTPSVSLDVDSLYTDADAHTRGSVTLGAVTGGAGGELDPGLGADELLFTPTNDGAAATYSAGYTVCDTGTPVAACTSATWTILYNDDPTLKTVAPIDVISGHTLNIVMGASANDIISGFGTVNSGSVTAQVAAPLGNYGSSATLGNGTCAVVGNTVVFTAAVGAADGDTCSIRVCECDGVCDTVDVLFTVVGCLSDLDCDEDEVCGANDTCEPDVP